MIMDLNFLIHLIVFTYELLDGVLFDHVQDISFRIKIGRVDIHNSVVFSFEIKDLNRIL